MPKSMSVVRCNSGQCGECICTHTQSRSVGAQERDHPVLRSKFSHFQLASSSAEAPSKSYNFYGVLHGHIGSYIQLSMRYDRNKKQKEQCNRFCLDCRLVRNRHHGLRRVVSNGNSVGFSRKNRFTAEGYAF